MPPPDSRCAVRRDLVSDAECMGLSIVGFFHDVVRGDNRAALNRNRRAVYLAADAAVIVLLLVAAGLLLNITLPARPSIHVHVT